jgi:HSP20 family protein
MHPQDDDIIRDIRHLQETMERLLSDFSRLHTPLLLGKESVWRPLTDVYETDKEYVIRMEIAGMHPDDFNVTLDNRVFTIKGVRRDPPTEGQRHFHKMEISAGPFERNVEIPPNIRISSMEAHYENGYLLIRIRKGARRFKGGERIIPVERGF